MNLNQLHYFRLVCKHNNVTKAAEELHISQPAITKAIRELEHELGVELFHRKNKRLSLTVEGEVFLEKSQSILMEVTSLVDEMKDLGKKRRSVVRIGVPSVLTSFLLPRLIQETEQTLGVELEVFEMPSDDLLEMMDREELDVAAVLLEDAAYPNIDYSILLESRLCLCTWKKNPLAGKAQVRLSELAEEPLVLYTPGAIMKSLFKQSRVSPKYILHSNQMLTIRSYIKAGLASTFQFQLAFRDDEEIIAVPVEPCFPLNLAVVRKKDRKNSLAANGVYQYLCESFQVLE